MNGFDELNRLIEGDQVPLALNFLADRFRQTGEFHRLFEVRKMQSRWQVGLPVYYAERPPQTTPEQNQILEQSVLDACREVGQLLAAAGRVQQAWYYLQPLDDSQFTRAVLESAPQNEDSIQEIVEVSLYQAAHPELGYRIVLDKFGTCNSVTTFESIHQYLSLDHRAILAGMLVRHLARELRTNIMRALIESGENLGSPDSLTELNSLLNQYPQQIASRTPHLDATHLSSVVKIGRWTDDSKSWDVLLNLCQYGSLLPDSLQYPSDPPYQNTFADHHFFYSALLSPESVAIDKFYEQKLTAVIDPQSEMQTIQA